MLRPSTALSLRLSHGRDSFLLVVSRSQVIPLAGKKTTPVREVPFSHHKVPGPQQVLWFRISRVRRIERVSLGRALSCNPCSFTMRANHPVFLLLAAVLWQRTCATLDMPLCYADGVQCAGGLDDGDVPYRPCCSKGFVCEPKPGNSAESGKRYCIHLDSIHGSKTAPKCRRANERCMGDPAAGHASYVQCCNSEDECVRDPKLGPGAFCKPKSSDHSHVRQAIPASVRLSPDSNATNSYMCKASHARVGGVARHTRPQHSGASRSPILRHHVRQPSARRA